MQLLRVICLFVVCAVFPQANALSQSSLYKDLKNSYSKRQARIKSFRFTWEETTNYFQNPDSTELASVQAKIAQESSPEKKALLRSKLRTLQLPSNETVHRYEITQCGEKFSYSGQSTTANASGASETLDFKSAFNGEETRTRSSLKGSSDQYVDLQKGKSEQSYHSVLEDMACRPIFLFCRPKDILRPRIEQGMVNVGQVKRITDNGSEMVVLGGDSAATHHGYSTSYWFADGLNQAVVRELSASGNTPKSRLEIEYSPDPNFGFVPSSWIRTRFWPNGAVKQTSKSRVTSYEFNFACDSHDFEVPFSPGDMVSDRRGARRENLKVSDDLTLVPRDEIGTKSSYWIFVYVNLGLVCCLVLFMCLKTFRKE